MSSASAHSSAFADIDLARGRIPFALVGPRPLALAGLDLRLDRDLDGDLVVALVTGGEVVARVVAQFGASLFLSGVWTSPGHRRGGVARALMGIVLGAADRAGVLVRLRINRFGEGGPDRSVQERFYAGFGFHRVAGEDLDGLPWEREPAGAFVEIALA